MKAPIKAKLLYLWREWAKPLLVVVIVLGALRSAVADWYDVPTGSMKPTIIEGDRIFVNKLAYDLRVPFTPWRLARWALPQRSDVVVLYAPHNGTRMVKRVIGLPGDRIELRNNRLLVNGEPIDYEPLDEEVIGQLAAEERGQHTYAVERLGGEGHAVMSTPALRGHRFFGPVIVPADRLFVMGDNRDNSLDSRSWGFAHSDRVLGRVDRVVLSLDKEHHYKPRWQRLLRDVP